MKKIMILVSIVAAIACLVFYGFVCWNIFADVREITHKGQQKFAGDSVAATIAMLESNATSFAEKNQAVYALGQIGDKRALPALQSKITSIPCPDPCTKDNYVCQYELEKAIKTCRGSFTVTRWMYRFL